MYCEYKEVPKTPGKPHGYTPAALYGTSVNHAGYCLCYERTYQPYIEAFVSYPCFLVIACERANAQTSSGDNA